MRKLEILLVAALLAGCTPVATVPTLPPPPAAVEPEPPPSEFPLWWPKFTERVNVLDGATLARERDLTLARYDAGADDAVRLRLAYLMSRGAPSRRDLDAGRELLAALDPAGEEAALGNLLKAELDARVQLDETRTQLRRLEGKVAELQGQLDALRAIEADLTEDRRYSESFTQ